VERGTGWPWQTRRSVALRWGVPRLYVRILAEYWVAFRKHHRPPPSGMSDDAASGHWPSPPALLRFAASRLRRPATGTAGLAAPRLPGLPTSAALARDRLGPPLTTPARLMPGTLIRRRYLSPVGGPGPDRKLLGAAKWSADAAWRRLPGPATPVRVTAGTGRRTGAAGWPAARLRPLPALPAATRGTPRGGGAQRVAQGP